MTLKTDTEKITKRKKPRPFLVLPLLEKLAMPKNANLKLFTKTWPPKKDSKNEDRPLTATLDKPTVLNISLIGIIDMSTVRKEFLNISNLCKFPISLNMGKSKRKKTAVINRPLSLPSPQKLKVFKKNKKRAESEDSYDDESSICMSVQSAKSKCQTNKTKNVEVLVKKKNFSDSNNNKTFKIPRKRVGNVVKLLDINKSDLGKSTKLPEPCKTCGRPDQPERFHSHPATPLKITKKPEDPPKMKSTVQKPVAMKYKSKQTTEKKPSTTQQRKPSLPAQKLVHSPPNIGTTAQPTTPRIKSPKRTLTCYICGREFGTASLHLHEPKCLQKWERENSSLPKEMQRKPPIKPAENLTQQEWNQMAWEASQSSLTPCVNCGRTFYPDRLIVHQRSCKNVDNNSKSLVEKSKPESPMGPRSVECYICGKKFGTHSIKIHEKQCLKKWHAENDCLPVDIRAPEPTRKDIGKIETPDLEGASKRSSVEKERPPSGKKSPMFPCYICGRLFTVNSIYIHEPQCLKMWKIENDKLPVNKRRPQPLKPDIKFTPTGEVDYIGTFHRIWDNHLAELVQCRKCGRKFFPDRIEIHENACARLPVNLKKKKAND